MSAAEIDYKIIQYTGTDKYVLILAENHKKELFAVYGKTFPPEINSKNEWIDWAEATFKIEFKAYKSALYYAIKLNNKEEFDTVEKVLFTIWGNNDG